VVIDASGESVDHLLKREDLLNIIMTRE
jgi:hypothetical protein